VVIALFLLVAQPGEAPDAGGAYQYAKLHGTLYGKMAALSHYDVLKTTEPLTCSDGVQNFTCLLSKTDLEFIQKIIDPSVYYIPVWSCHTKLSPGTYEPMPGGSSSPVYRLRIGPDYRYAVVDAYGIHIGRDKDTKELYVADISWIYVKVSWLG